MRAIVLAAFVAVVLCVGCTERPAASAVEEVTTVTEVCAGDCLRGAFSPDGKRVAYIRGNDVRVYDLSTGEDRALLAGSQAAWMPDSRRIVVAVTRDDGRDTISSKLYLVSLDGAKQAVRTVPDSIPLYPDIAGKRLLYTDHASGRILVHSLETE